MLRCAVIGATGYTGAELVKILLRHPRVQLEALTTRQETAIPLKDLVPGVSKKSPLEIRKFSLPEIKRKADVVFLALPHTEAMGTAQEFLRAGKIVIDLSADFRIKSASVYEKWYGVKHRAKKFLRHAVYGLPEIYRDSIQKADLIANPGCYPTAACLGIAPLVRDGLVELDSIIIDAKSGVTGAGKKLNPATQFCEVDENFYAYKVNRHQHTPEIEQVLSETAGDNIHVTFVPHLLPLNRGILTSIYMKKRGSVRVSDIRKSFEKAYGEEPFVRLRKDGEFPALRNVQGTNFCDIGFTSEPDEDEVIVITAIDNLVKGASGQAVQNMNIRCGLPEEEGLLG
ncbi:MAG: N-acetyl-gamma-glutamyl-phosphate reductase [Candidatus Omnitrophica bacterium]|nr:N-acetyl-gamma-glutamyl-phosphate reductase [Candidatus Omnitrophota bacterium]